MYSIIFIEFLLFHASRGERGAKRRVKRPEAPTESWPADVRSELRQILPMHIGVFISSQNNTVLDCIRICACHAVINLLSPFLGPRPAQ